MYWYALSLLHGCMVQCEAAAVSTQVLCTPFTHTPVYSVTSFKDTLVGCVCVYLDVCNLPLALLAE